MYVSGYIIPVPEGKKEAYRQVAEDFWPIAKDYGALAQIECWEADVKDGKQTDFRRAVAIEPGEKVVFSWMLWPDRETCDGAHDKMMQDERMAGFSAEMPFDGKRMVVGGFDPIVWQEAK